MSNIKYEVYDIDTLVNNLDIIDKMYHIENIITTSTKKATYLVRDNSNKYYIMKVKLKDFISDELIEIYKKIKKNPNPNINKIITIFMTSKLLIVISEYIDGFSLLSDKMVDSNISIIKIFKDCLLGLAHMHTLVILHTDIKPEHIMIRKNIDDSSKINYEAILIDFDMCKFSNNTVINCNRGTIGYIAPECQMGIISPYSDIWALGITFYYYFHKKIQMENSDNLIHTSSYNSNSNSSNESNNEPNNGSSNSINLDDIIDEKLLEYYSGNEKRMLRVITKMINQNQYQRPTIQNVINFIV
jgi:serine/threonine protein kinase